MAPTKALPKKAPVYGYLVNGGWRDYWMKNAATIRRFIQEENLKPADPKQIPQLAKLAMAPGKANPRELIPQFMRWDPDIRGGIRVAHLHLDDKIFLLDEKQWGRFVEKILTEAKQNLAATSNLPFENEIEVGAVMEMAGKSFPG